MLTRFFTSFGPPRFRRIHLSLFLLPLAWLLLPIGARAQVTFNGVLGQQYVNFHSEAVGSRSATISLPFTIGSDVSTKVGSIGVLTTGVAGKDFAAVTGSTSCAATTYAAETNCVVNVTFKPWPLACASALWCFIPAAAKPAPFWHRCRFLALAPGRKWPLGRAVCRPLWEVTLSVPQAWPWMRPAMCSSPISTSRRCSK